MAAQPGQAAEQPSVEQRLARYFSGDEPQADSQPEAEPEPQEQEQQAQDQEQPAETPEGESEAQAEDAVEVDLDAPFMEITTKSEGGADEKRMWSLKEMRDGVMMKQDYQRKTAELARAREQMSQEVMRAVEPTRQQYMQQLQFMQAAVQNLVLPELQGADMEKLASESPADFVKLQARMQRAQQAFGAIQQQLTNAQQEQMQQHAVYSKQMLSDPIEGIPGWSDQMYSTIINEGAKQYRFAPEEVANVVDYRMIKVLNDALDYRKLAAAKPKISKQVVNSPKVLKPGSARDASDAQAQEDKKLRQRLRESGDVRDAAALYAQRLSRR
jgi:hypothetical protein